MRYYEARRRSGQLIIAATPLGVRIDGADRDGVGLQLSQTSTQAQEEAP